MLILMILFMQDIIRLPNKMGPAAHVHSALNIILCRRTCAFMDVVR